MDLELFDQIIDNAKAQLEKGTCKGVCYALKSSTVIRQDLEGYRNITCDYTYVLSIKSRFESMFHPRATSCSPFWWSQNPRGKEQRLLALDLFREIYIFQKVTIKNFRSLKWEEV